MRIGTMAKGRPIIWLCLLALLLGQVLAACGSSSTTTNPNGPVDLNVWINPAATEAASPGSDWELYKIVKQKFNINLHFTFLPSGADGNTKMNSAAASNSLPDLFQVIDTNLLLTWIDNGLVGPVNDLFKDMPNRTKDRYSDPTLNKLFTIDGKQYALQESAKAKLTKRQGLFIRQDWLDKLGLQTPKTLDDLMKVAKAFTSDDPDGNGKNDTYGFGAMIEDSIGLGSRFSFVYGAYGLPDPWNYSDPTKASLSVRAPEYLEATKYIKSMVDNKVIDPDWTTLKKDDFRAHWKQGKFGILIEDFCALLCQANYKPFSDNFPNASFTLLDPLKVNSTSTITPYIGSYLDAGNALAVSKKAIDEGKGPAIAKLLEWLNSGEGYYLAAFGKEGVNYKLDADGNVSVDGVPEPYTKDPGRIAVQIRNLALNGDPKELVQRYPSFETANGQTQDPLKVYQEVSSQSWQNTTSDLVIKPAANQADINRYINENIVQFVTGQKALDNNSWNSFLQGMDGLGVADWEQAANTTLQERGFLQK